jgi:hypothetical protein
LTTGPILLKTAYDSYVQNYEKCIGGIYRCNITDIFLMSNKTLPVFYLNVTYERPLQKHFII